MNDEALTYEVMRAMASSGDVIVCKDRTLTGVTIRVLTAESFNHVAVLVWLEDGLWIAEMTGRGGFTITPASEWVAKRLRKGELLYCQAPAIVRKNEKAVVDAVLSSRRMKYPYSFTTLVRVWVSQLLGKRVGGLFVCSTWAQYVWETTGYSQFKRLADPGAFPMLAWRSRPIVA